VTDFAKIKSCRDITDDQIAEAIETREDTRALLEHAAKIGSPRTGGARVLLLFARMASPSCDWLDGALRVEIASAGDNSEVSNIETFADIGAGLKERIFPLIAIGVPIEEFVIAVKKFPKAIAPLSFTRPSPRRVVLTAGEVEKIQRASSAPPPRARLKTPPALSLGDLPTVGAAPKSSPPPQPAAHLPAVVMSASEIPPAPAQAETRRAQIPKFPTKTELRIGTAPKIPPPVRKKTEPLPVFVPGADYLPKPVAELPQSPPAEGPALEPAPAPEPAHASEPAPAPEADLPAVAPAKPLARIQLRRQQTPATLPRVVEEIDARSPAVPRKKAAAAKKPFAVPPPKASEPPPKSAAEPENQADPEPAPTNVAKDVDEGWE
jgi:hypothetical protein